MPDKALWFIVVTFWGLGDTVTTVLAIQRYGIEERNTVMRLIFEKYGVWSAVPVKALALSVMYFGWVVLESPFSTYVLVPVAVLGVIVTGWNVRQLRRAASYEKRKLT